MAQQSSNYATVYEGEGARAQLPADIEAEESVLAACMHSADVNDEIVTSLLPENFFRPAHQIIYEAMMEMSREGLAPDAVSLADKLQAKGQLEQIGGRAKLVDLYANTFALTNWRRHVDIVKRTSIQRGLIRAAAEINAIAYDAPEDINAVVGQAESTLFNVTEKRISSNFVKMDSLIADAFANLEEISKQGDSVVGVPTGFRDVDGLIHGFRAGDLVILAARPGVGKTSFALNLAVNAAKAGTAVAFFSLEMDRRQLTQRILCAEARVSLSKIRSGKIAEGDWVALGQAASTLSQLEIYIDDSADLTILQARAKARRELRQVCAQGKKGLIVIDYLQLMSPAVPRRDGNRAVEVGEISRGLKILAKEMEMPVIALSQLSRAIEQRGKSKRPMLSDLRESGSIEQDADIVAFIDRSMDEIEAESSERPDLGTANLIVAKHRNGATADITLSFNAEYTKFGDYYDESRAVGF
jgi:replicative DNA helicase